MLEIESGIGLWRNGEVEEEEGEEAGEVERKYKRGGEKPRECKC